MYFLQQNHPWMEDLTAVISLMEGLSDEHKINLELLNVTISNSRLSVRGLNIVVNQAILGDLNVIGQPHKQGASVTMTTSTFAHLGTKSGYRIEVINCTLPENDKTDGY